MFSLYSGSKEYFSLSPIQMLFLYLDHFEYINIISRNVIVLIRINEDWKIMMNLTIAVTLRSANSKCDLVKLS